ncbi:MAG: hypothetical protein GX020_06580 [Firmicutes bacterium]|nr:hypothetical protein [Bacillota bacterium]
MKRKWIKHILILLCVLALGGISLFGVRQFWFNPYRGTVSAFRPSERLDTILSGPQAVADLDYIVARLKERHPACIHGLPDKMQTEYKKERQRLTASPGVSVLSLWQSAARLLAILGDAHTSVGVEYLDGKHLPLSFRWEQDTLYCLGSQYSSYAVVQIGGIAVADLYQKFLEQFSFELEAWARHSFASRLTRGEYLSFLGVDTEGEISIVLADTKNSDHITIGFSLHERIEDGADKTEGDFEYVLDLAAGVGIFSLYHCVYNEEYKEGLLDFFMQVQDNDILSVIVDLRGNPGGDSRVANEFVRYLPVDSYLTMTTEVREGPIIWKNKSRQQENPRLEPAFTGDVYVLTSSDTFSAAMDFAVLISDNGLGKVIGESPGNMPSSYGDVLYFQTPNAGLAFTVSYKYFLRPDVSKRDLPLIPDIEVPAEDALTEALRLIGMTSDIQAGEI